MSEEKKVLDISSKEIFDVFKESTRNPARRHRWHPLYRNW